MIDIIKATDSGFETALTRILRRLEIFEQTASPSAERRTREIFGKPLTPREVVRKIVEDVRKDGDEAVLEYIRQIDSCELTAEQLEITQDEIDTAYEGVSEQLIDAIRQSIKNVESYQETIKLAERHKFERQGATIDTIYRPLKSVGVYAPGGLGAYPSTIVMAVVPARVAGVERVAVTTPCDSSGAISPATLVAAKEAGAHAVYRVGGAHGIAALAFGTETVERVDKIVGPGNLFVMLAKKEVFGHVDIDMFAGPSEILIIADAVANESYIAADMLSQAEHDTMASAILVTTSEQLAEAVAEELDRQIEELPSGHIAAEALENYGLIAVVETLDECIEIADRIAPEHLEVITAQPQEVAPKLRNAGAIFVGPHTPEVVGDYIAGSSHILPTGGTARFFSGLSVNDFLRKTAVIEYTPAALRGVLDHLVEIGVAEGFAAHVASAKIRFPEPDETKIKKN